MSKTAIQIGHITEMAGPVQFLASYLEKNNYDYYRIYHPLSVSKERSTFFYRKEIELTVIERKSVGFLTFFYDFYLSCKFIMRVRREINFAIGMNCFDVLPFLILKPFLKINKIIFFNTDFSRRRFNNWVMNAIYVAVDRYVAMRVDVLCCNTQRTIKKRIEEGVVESRIIYTPNGVFVDDLGKIKKKTLKKQLIYVGHISEDHGIQKIIYYLKGTNIKLFIMGSGPYEKNLVELSRSLKLMDQVIFLGRKKHSEVISFLSNFEGFGIANYKIIDSDWVYYCDPVKVKEYLACNIPVIISDIPEVSEKIMKKKLGFVYKKDEDIKDILIKINKLTIMRFTEMISNIHNERDQIDLNKIFKRIFI